ncbi:17162_t:CDS:2 [Rhizophagus irregularis]|nr:17162_t:CDS:2 [Rhizophagus irregularis]
MTSRACVFINSNPKVRNKLINTISCIKPKFPPNINLRELITKQTFSESSRSSGRSPNAFIIYRKAFVEAARKDGYHLPMTVVSSMASRSWDLEPGEVKEHYKRLAKEANAIRNKLVPKLNKKRRQKWNIVSFPPPTSSVTNNKTRSKKKKVEIKENPSSSTGIPPISFHIPYDICSKIEDRYSSLDDSTIKLIIGEQIIDTFNVAVDIPIDINNDFEYDSFGFSTLFNECEEYEVYYPSILGG